MVTSLRSGRPAACVYPHKAPLPVNEELTNISHWLTDIIMKALKFEQEGWEDWSYSSEIYAHVEG